MLEKSGMTTPKAMKTGTTIVGLVYKVKLIWKWRRIRNVEMLKCWCRMRNLKLKLKRKICIFCSSSLFKIRKTKKIEFNLNSSEICFFVFKWFEFKFQEFHLLKHFASFVISKKKKIDLKLLKKKIFNLIISFWRLKDWIFKIFFFFYFIFFFIFKLRISLHSFYKTLIFKFQFKFFLGWNCFGCRYKVRLKTLLFLKKNHYFHYFRYFHYIKSFFFF